MTPAGNGTGVPVPAQPGRPLVVFSGGVGVPAEVWDETIAHLPGGVGHVHAERPGLSWIPGWRLGEMPTLASEAARIVGVLKRARAAGAAPVILVAHSAAGFFAEAVEIGHPGLADGVLLLDSSTTDRAMPAFPGFVGASHLFGNITAPLVRRAFPEAPGEGWRSALVENAAFRYWASDLRRARHGDHRRTAHRAPGGPHVRAVTVVSALPGAPGVLGDIPAVDTLLRAIGVRVWGMPQRRLVRRWRRLAAGAEPRQVRLYPCAHMVMLDKPRLVAGEIRRLIDRAGGGCP